MSATAVMMRGQARWIEESAAAWEREEAKLRQVRVVELLTPPFVNMAAFIEERVRESWRELRQSPTTYPAQETGEELAEWFALASTAFDALEDCFRSAEAEGSRLDGAEASRAARAKLVALHERFRDGWPMLDAKEAEAASARIAAGDFVALEDLARALDGPP